MYLNDAMRNLGVMMDCGVRKYGFTIEEFYDKFLSCEASRQFAHGNPRYLVGVSGVELADIVVEASGGMISEKNDGSYTVGPEYWAGGLWRTINGVLAAASHICRSTALVSARS